jgi:hypothetical protein
MEDENSGKMLETQLTDETETKAVETDSNRQSRNGTRTDNREQRCKNIHRTRDERNRAETP